MSRGNVTFMGWCHATGSKNRSFDWPLQHAAQALYVGLDPVWFPKTWHATTKFLIRRLANVFSRHFGMAEWNGIRCNNDWTSSSSTFCFLRFPPKKFHAAISNYKQARSEKSLMSRVMEGWIYTMRIKTLIIPCLCDVSNLLISVWGSRTGAGCACQGGSAVSNYLITMFFSWVPKGVGCVSRDLSIHFTCLLMASCI